MSNIKEKTKQVHTVTFCANCFFSDSHVPVSIEQLTFPKNQSIKGWNLGLNVFLIFTTICSCNSMREEDGGGGG